MKPVIAKEVKEEILAKGKAGETAASVAQKFGISVKTIYGWLRWNTVKGVSWLDYAKLKRENQQLFVEAIHQTIQYYNNRRIHTKLKMSPIKFKLNFLSRNM